MKGPAKNNPPAKQGPKPVPVKSTQRKNNTVAPKRGTNKKLGV